MAIEMELKEFMFTFEGGGWNTVWAKLVEEQLKKQFVNTQITQDWL